VIIHHHADRFGTHRAFRLAQIHEEQREPARFFAGWRRRGAREEEHEIGVLQPRGPALLAVDHVDIAVPDRFRADLRRVAAGRRFRDAECLQAQFSARDRRQPLSFLGRAAVAQQCSHDVHLGVGRTRISASMVDFLGDDRRVRKRQAQPSVLVRDQRGEEPILGERADELLGIGPLSVEFAPVRVAECGARLPHAGAQHLLRRCVGQSDWALRRDPRRLGRCRRRFV